MAGAAGGDGSDRRNPRTMEGLFKFCLEATKSEDVVPEASANLQPMDPERRAWLQEVLDSLSGNDPVKAMLNNLKVITDNEQQVAAQEQALEDLQVYCEDLDLAIDFHKIGGFTILSQLLHSDHEGIRWRTADLLAALVQNNPYCQQVALQENLLPILLRILDRDPSYKVQVKALFAISCLARDVPAALEVFSKNDGFSVVLRAMQRNEEKLQIKAAFMLRALFDHDPKYKDVLSDIGMVEQLAGLLRGEHTSSHEHLLAALLSLTRDHPHSLGECRRPELNLKQIFEQKKQELKGKPEYQEELEYSEELYSLCFGGNSIPGTVDR